MHQNINIVPSSVISENFLILDDKDLFFFACLDPEVFQLSILFQIRRINSDYLNLLAHLFLFLLIALGIRVRKYVLVFQSIFEVAKNRLRSTAKKTPKVSHVHDKERVLFDKLLPIAL